jgi:hypothetical protein
MGPSTNDVFDCGFYYISFREGYAMNKKLCPHKIERNNITSFLPNEFMFPHSNFHDSKTPNCSQPRCKRLYCYICKYHIGGEYTKGEELK